MSRTQRPKPSSINNNDDNKDHSKFGICVSDLRENDSAYNSHM